MKKEQDFKNIAVRLNDVRLQQKNAEFSTQELETLLKGILPTDCSSKVELVRANIVVRIQRGVYCFPDHPIHWHCIRNFYVQSRERSNNYRKKNSGPTASDVQMMIETLKNLGYVIFKRV